MRGPGFKPQHNTEWERVIVTVMTGDSLKGKWGEVSKMAEQVKVLVAKTGELSSTPRTHSGSKEPVPMSCPPTSTPVHTSTHTVIKQLKSNGSPRLSMQMYPSLPLHMSCPFESFCCSFYYLPL